MEIQEMKYILSNMWLNDLLSFRNLNFFIILLYKGKGRTLPKKDCATWTFFFPLLLLLVLPDVCLDN